MNPESEPRAHTLTSALRCLAQAPAVECWRGEEHLRTTLLTNGGPEHILPAAPTPCSLSSPLWFLCFEHGLIIAGNTSLGFLRIAGRSLNKARTAQCLTRNTCFGDCFSIIVMKKTPLMASRRENRTEKRAEEKEEFLTRGRRAELRLKRERTSLSRRL